MAALFEILIQAKVEALGYYLFSSWRRALIALLLVAAIAFLVWALVYGAAPA